MSTKLTAYGGAGSVTGANFLLEISSKKVLVDCGMTQGSREASRANYAPFEYDPSTIDYLFVTHAHIDHTGLIPKLVRLGFKGTIYSTPETQDIAELMLIDSAKINSYKENPLYTQADVDRSLGLWQTIKYHEVRDFLDFSAELFDAGHVLGSASIKFSTERGSMLFSGDLGNQPSPLLKAPEQVSRLDYLLIESVYGDRRHEDELVRTDKLKQAVQDITKSGGTLLIPTFSLERTQVLLSQLDNLFESHELEQIPVFLDSPLAIRITNVYERAIKHYKKSVQEEAMAGDKIFEFPRLKETAQVRDSREIEKVRGPKVIMAGSGMSMGGRIMGHEARYLPLKNTIIMFVGYQAPGTLGREIREGAKRVRIGERMVPVRAEVRSIDGFSAHADSDELVEYAGVSQETLKQVFVAMGEPRSSLFLAQRLHDELDLDAVVPEKGRVYELDI